MSNRDNDAEQQLELLAGDLEIVVEIAPLAGQRDSIETDGPMQPEHV